MATIRIILTLGTRTACSSALGLLDDLEAIPKGTLAFGHPAHDVRRVDLAIVSGDGGNVRRGGEDRGTHPGFNRRVVDTVAQSKANGCRDVKRSWDNGRMCRSDIDEMVTIQSKESASFRVAAALL